MKINTRLNSVFNYILTGSFPEHLENTRSWLLKFFAAGTKFMTATYKSKLTLFPINLGFEYNHLMKLKDISRSVKYHKIAFNTRKHSTLIMNNIWFLCSNEKLQ